MSMKLRIDERRILHRADEMIYGQFIEHFGTMIYGTLYDPTHPKADADGFRSDVLEALKKLRIPCIRWPGGCFVSAYHWKDGIGPVRESVYDKAWCVEESNAFGTDEFMKLCQKLDCEPYLCTNAGTGTPEEMSDWVEYCNEPKWGKWAKLRIDNGHPEPYKVKYWSIGNENYTSGEIGAKTIAVWGPFVRESAKMMRRVDPTIKLLAAAVPEVDWNLALLRSAGDLLDYISIHGYFDEAWNTGNLSSYEKSLQAADKFEQEIIATRGLLMALGLEKRIKIAFDEWNLRGWYHPGISDFSNLTGDHEWAAAQREKNEINSQYTMADAVFTAIFLNTCMRHGDIVTMANFSPAVYGRGLLSANKEGIVLRPTYHVFDLLRNHMGNDIVGSYIVDGETCDAEGVSVPAVDAAAALDDQKRLTVSLVNRHPDKEIGCMLETANVFSHAKLLTLNGPNKDSFNDFDHPDTIKITHRAVPVSDVILLEPHSVNVLVCE